MRTQEELSFEAAVALAQDVDAMQTWFESYWEMVDPNTRIRRCRVDRIRLRSGARMVVQYAVDVSDASQLVERTLTVTGCIHATKSAEQIVAKMIKDDSWSDLLSACGPGLPRVFAIPFMNMLVQIFPIDRRLPGLARIYPQLPEYAQQQLAEKQHDSRWREQPVTSECVRYRSGLNAVLRYSLEQTASGGDHAVYAKVYSSAEESEAAFAFLHQLDRQTKDLGLRCSRPICGWPEFAAMVLASATGNTLETELQRSHGLDALERTTDTLANLATSSVRIDPVHASPDQAACLQRSLKQLKRIGSDRLPEIHQLEAWIRYPASALAATHRDLKLEHIYLDESQITFIDCDSFSMADPVIDVAMLAARVLAFGQRQRVETTLTNHRINTLVARYFAQVPTAWQSRWAVHFAGALLEIAVGYYGRQETDWHSTVNFLIDQAVAAQQADGQATGIYLS
ncbi:MAG: phosphotransferase [Planctomycetales bacterium]|nr:phosphotransferase [Planctomycetales bacterium]